MLELRQTQKLAQQLCLTPQLQQAIKLLQLSQIELVEAIEKEIRENPVLEIEEELLSSSPANENDKKADLAEWLERFSPSEGPARKEIKDYQEYEGGARKNNDRRDYLRWQVGVSDFDKDQRISAEWIIEHIDGNGYLGTPVEEIAQVSGIPDARLSAVLQKIQKLDPPGVGARDLKECLLIQYRDKGENDPVLETILETHLELFGKMDIREIAKRTEQPTEKVLEALAKIRTFDPKPARSFDGDQTIYIVPDVFVTQTENGYDVQVNGDGVPDLKLNTYYTKNLSCSGKLDDLAKDYIKQKIRQAEWFMKTLSQRQRTLYLASKTIVDFQADFFEKGIRYLRPLNLKDVANHIGVHESTASRITTNKYMGTPFGTFEMKFFFTTGVGRDHHAALSTTVVMDLITEIIAKENPAHPLNDQEIAVLLEEKHKLKVARRTVTKYRENLRIGSTRDRKRNFG